MTPVIRAIARASFAAQCLVAIGGDGALGRLGPYLATPDRWLRIDPRAPDAAARTMEAVDALCAQMKPDVLVVAGGSEAILSAVFAASRRDVRIARLESGIRTDEPAHRRGALVDRLADLHFTSSAGRDARLLAEGVPAARIHRVGSLLVDAILEALPTARVLSTPAWLGLSPGRYAMALFGRERDRGIGDFERFVDAIERVQRRLPVVVSLSRAIDEQITGTDLADRLRSLPNVRPWQRADPLERLDLIANARFVLTNEPLVQEMTSGLGLPCLTLAQDVARAVTLTEGSNYLVGLDAVAIDRAAEALVRSPGKAGCKPRMWDGRASERIVEVLRPAAPQEEAVPAALREAFGPVEITVSFDETTRTAPQARASA